MLALAVHFIFTLTLSDQKWVTPFGVSLVLAVVLAYAVRWANASSGDMQLRWACLATAFGLWILGYAASAISQLSDGDTSVALPYLLLFALRGVPWFLAMVRTTDRKVLADTHYFDLLQAALFAIAALMLYFPHLAAGSTLPIAPLSGQLATTYHDLVNALIAVLSLAFVRLQPTVAERTFARNLALLLVSYAVTAFFVNHIVIERMGPPAGSPWFVLSNLPTLLFLGVTLRTGNQLRDFTALPPRAMRNTMLLLVPAAMPAGVILMALALASSRPIVAGVLAMGAVLLIAGRSVLTQQAYSRAHIELTGARDTMAWLAQHDELTGLANRRHFSERLASTWTQCAHDDKFLSVLFVDVDHFKQYNDALGHAGGDECLRQIASLLKTSGGLRENDLVARYGGEEFVLLLPATDPGAAATIGERVRKTIECAGIEHPTAPLAKVTVSIGAASVRPGIALEDVSSLIRNADDALYLAKNHGRNRVVGPNLSSIVRSLVR